MEDENIRHHLAAMNEAWQRYDKLECGTYNSYLPPMDQRRLGDKLNQAYRTHWWWLVEHGIDDHCLTYDSTSKTFTLPDELPSDRAMRRKTTPP